VVATAALGHLESIVDEETGLLVPAEDVGALAKAVLRLIEDQDFARQLAAEARARALERFGTERYSREVTTLVRQLVTRPGRAVS
jgi:glycosyltransferase involved in cell wall biosynthesis